ncbi:MAG: hypothetical protein RJB34_937 [Pseudomonadota bacterium]
MSTRPPVNLIDAQRRTGQAMPSPCVSVCEMDEASASCKGCFRTLDEIAVWSILDDAEKQAVWAAIEARQNLA